jgi:hypothetical protein
VLVKGGRDAGYLPTGHLVYARGSTLLAVRFDPSTRQASGGPVSLLDGLGRSAWAWSDRRVRRSSPCRPAERWPA